MEYKIYLIKCKTNNKGYVGITSGTLEERWNIHLKGAEMQRKMANGKIIPFMAAINKYGPKNFTIKILEKVDSIKKAYLKEKYYIKKLRTFASGPVPRLGYNCTLGGENLHKI